jgi:hypothetical protein
MSKILSMVPGVVAANVRAINKDKIDKSAKQVLTKQESVNKNNAEKEGKEGNAEKEGKKEDNKQGKEGKEGSNKKNG